MTHDSYTNTQHSITTTGNASFNHSTPDLLKRSMVRLADTVRTLHRIAHRIRNGLSPDEFPDPVFRDYDIIGSTDRSNSNRDNFVVPTNHIVNGLYNAKQKPRKRAPYVPYL